MGLIDDPSPFSNGFVSLLCMIGNKCVIIFKLNGKIKNSLVQNLIYKQI